MEAVRPTLLLVDDDEAFRTRLGRALEARGYSVRGAADAPEALTLAAEESPEYAVIDLRMPGPSGLELLKALLERDPTTRVVVLTGYGSIATAVQATRIGAVNYLAKPVDADEVVQALSGAETPDASPTETPSLARVEWEHIQRVMAACEGNISEAARQLGVHRRSLQRKLQKYPPRR